MEELFRRKIWQLKELGYAAVDDETTQQTMRELKELGYTSEPHAAVAYRALRDQLNPGEYGLFLGTAHPAKFKESVEAILGETLDLPKSWQNVLIYPCFHIICPPILLRCVN